MPAQNLTGVPIQPSIWSDLGLGEKEKELTDEEKKRRKKRMMGAAATDLLPNMAMQPIYGS